MHRLIISLFKRNKLIEDKSGRDEEKSDCKADRDETVKEYATIYKAFEQDASINKACC